MATSGGSSVPRIMVFRPTMEEFKKFPEFIQKMESQGAHKAGIAKIIPPENWCPRKGGYDDISLVIPAPISQVVTGSQGLFQQINIQQKCMNVQEFRKLAESPKYRTPPHFDYEDLERKYWKNITYNSPIYGADVSGSLYDDGIEEFNIQHLNTVLDLVADDYGIKIDGVNTAYLYFGMWKTTFAWHTEDMDLYSINYLHFGAPKSWYAIPPEHGRRLERLAAGFFHGSFQSCPAFLRHKMTIISPQILKKYCIPFNKITQEPGEFMITFPFGYHSGFNHGFNCAESTNFAMPRWVEYGKRALSCTCRNDCVKICMDMFVRKFQPERYELWKLGKDVGPHPEDPSRHYAAAPPNKAELAIAAQREERRKARKTDYSQKLKRHPISKISKADANFGIASLQNAKIESVDKSDSEETEIYDVEEILKKPKGERKIARENGKNAPRRKKVGKKLNSGKNLPPKSVVAHDVSENYSDSVLSPCISNDSALTHDASKASDSPPDLKPFWDPEVEKPKISFLDCTVASQCYATDVNASAFVRYPCINAITANGSSCTSMIPQSTLPPNSQQLDPAIRVKQEPADSNLLDSLNPYLELSTSSANTEDIKPPRISLEQGIKESFIPNLVRPEWMCKKTEHGLKLKIVSPRKLPNQVVSSSGLKELFQSPSVFETFQSSSPSLDHNNSCTPCNDNSVLRDSKTELSLSLSDRVSKNKTKIKKESEDSEVSLNITPNDSAILNETTVKNKKGRKKRGDAEGSGGHGCKKRSKRKSVRNIKEAPVNWAYPITDIHQHEEFDVEAEKQFNVHMSLMEPHCSVCIIFSSMNNETSAPSEQPGVPSSSPVKMPAFCFSKSVDNHCTFDANPLLARDGTSPLLVCANCNVCVHAFCYGITIIKLGPWLCTRCTVQAEDAACCLCVLRGGALQPTTDGRWAHIVCATLIEEAFFGNVVLRKPVDVSQMTSQRMSLNCIYCSRSLVSDKDSGSCCIQCKSGRCAAPFHVTCGHLAGAYFECRDWPDPINIVCTRHSRKTKSFKRHFTEVSVGDKVLAKHKNRRYYWAQMKKKYCQVYYSVLFADNSTSSNLLPEDIVDEKGVQRGLPEINERVLVKWTDGLLYSSIFKGSRSCDVYVIEFYDGTVTDLERHQFFAADEELPKEVSSRVSSYSDAKGASSHTVEPNSKRIRYTNSKYMSSILLPP